jgi:hypothetical protein
MWAASGTPESGSTQYNGPGDTSGHVDIPEGVPRNPLLLSSSHFPHQHVSRRENRRAQFGHQLPRLASIAYVIENTMIDY